MYAKTNIKAGKRKAGQRSCGGDSSLRIKQRGLHNPVQQCNKASVRYSSAIQQIQQRRIVSFFPVYVRKARVEVSRHAFKSESRAIRAGSVNSNRSRAATKQGQLVRHGMVGARQDNRVRDQREKLSSQLIPKLDPNKCGNKAKATSQGNKKGSL